MMAAHRGVVLREEFPAPWDPDQRVADLSRCLFRSSGRCYCCETDETFCLVRWAVRQSCHGIQNCEARWAKLRDQGDISDDELVQALRFEFGQIGGTGPGGIWYQAQGSAKPSVTLRDRAGNRVVINGRRLLQTVREELVLGELLKPARYWKVEQDICRSGCEHFRTRTCLDVETSTFCAAAENQQQFPMHWWVFDGAAVDCRGYAGAINTHDRDSEWDSHGVAQTDLGMVDRYRYRQTPPGEPTVADLLPPGTVITANYWGHERPGIVISVSEESYDAPEGGHYTYHGLAYVPEDVFDQKRHESHYRWINELVAVGGRILKLFENNPDEVIIVDAAPRHRTEKTGQLAMFWGDLK